MQNSLWTKGLAVGIIMLFVGTSVIPGISGIIKDGNDSTVHTDVPTVLRLAKSGFNNGEIESIDTSSFRNGVQRFSAGNESIIFDNKGSSSLGYRDEKWQWAKRAGGTLTDYGLDIAMDNFGNTYVTGYFNGTATFGSTTLTSQGYEDVFVAKLNTNGDWQWARQAGGTGYDGGKSIAVDAGGNTYITGWFEGNVRFGNTILISKGSEDVFIAKLNTDGTWQWAKSAGGTHADEGRGVAADAYGNAYITGCFWGTATFGATTLIGGQFVFVAKLDTNGIWQWARQSGGTNANFGSNIAVDADGNTYITGYFYSTATFGTTSLTDTGSGDVFIAKLDTDGVWEWARQAGGTSSGVDEGGGIAVDAVGNVYITGWFYDTATFGTTILNGRGVFEVFVAKLDTNGVWQWAQRAGGTKDDSGNDVAVDASGNVYITGRILGNGTFGTMITSLGAEGNLFVAKLDTNGVWQWAQREGTNRSQGGMGICVDFRGSNIYITGFFISTVTFGTTTLTSQGYHDVFVAKLSGDGGNQPDLIAQDITIPNYMVEGYPYRIEVTIHNIGGASAQYNFKVRFAKWGPSDTDWVTLENLNVFQLGPGQSTTVGTWLIPDKPGVYKIKVIADANNEITESNELNNEQTSTITVLSTIQIIPSHKYNIDSETLDIRAVVHNNILNQDITTGALTLTWKLYDADGNIVPGYGGTSDPFVFNSDPDYYCWENLGNDVSSLTTGKIYTIELLYNLGHTKTRINFLKASGYASLHGHVYDGFGNPLTNVPVKARNFFHNKLYQTTTDVNGYYHFDDIPVGTCSWFKITISDPDPVNPPDYLSKSRVILIISDSVYEKDFTLVENLLRGFKLLLTPIKDACQNVKDTETNDLGVIRAKVSHYGDIDVTKETASFIGSVMCVDSSKVASATVEKAVGTTAINALREALKHYMLWNIPKAVGDRFMMISQKVLLSLIIDQLDKSLQNSDVYILTGSLIDEYHSSFQSEAPSTIADYFSLERANALVNTVSDQLNNVDSTIYIPFDYEHPVVFLFPASRDAFNSWHNAKQAAETGGNCCIWIQIGCGVGSILCCIFAPEAAPAVVPTLLGVGWGGGAAGTVSTAVELGAQSGAYVEFGKSAVNWVNDLGQLPSVMYTSKNWFLNEGLNPYYLDGRRDFNVDITECNIVGDYTVKGIPVIVVTDNGVAENALTLHVKNMDDYPVNLITEISYQGLKDYRYTQNLAGGDTWVLTDGDSDVDGKYSFLIPDKESAAMLSALTVMGLLDPFTLVSTVHTGLPGLFTPDVETADYLVALPSSRGSRGGTLGSDTSLNMRSSEGRLTLGDVGKYVSKVHTLIDTNLSVGNSVVDMNFTVSGNTSSVDFLFVKPPSSIVDFCVYDSDGHRIGHNFSTGLDDIEFIGSFNIENSNCQRISIPYAANKTYWVHMQLAMEYLDNQSHHVIVKAYERPFRPALLSAGPDDVPGTASYGMNASLSVWFSECGRFESLKNVTVELSTVSKDGVVLPTVSSSFVDVGPVLPGTGSSVDFKLFIPESISEGWYTGLIYVNSSNAGGLTLNARVLVDATPPSVVPNPPLYPGSQSGSYLYDTVLLNVSAVDTLSGVSSVVVNTSMISLNDSIMLNRVGDSSYFVGEVVVDRYCFGVCSLQVMAYDKAGNVNDGRSIDVNVLYGVLNLSAGWNLVSVPMSYDWRASNLSENISGCQMISRFDGVNQTYKTFIVGGPPSFDFPIIDGFGYFVLVNQSSTFSMSGYRIDSVSVALCIGWNMIGWYHSSETLASSLGGNISGCQMISWFDAVNQSFKTFIVGGPPSFDFSITPGMGLFVLVDTASVWHGEG